MGLNSLLDELKRSRNPITSVRLPGRLALEKSYKRVAERYDREVSVTALDYEALLVKLRACADARSMEALSIREVRLAASCLFDHTPSLADDELLLDNICRY